MHGADLAIVGGGIVGLCSALEAARMGLSVVICDRPLEGRASRAAAGMLAPSLDGMPLHILPHALAARDFYPGFLGALEDATGIEVPLNRNGILEVAHSEAELDSLASRRPAWAELLDGASLGALEPALSSHCGALLHPLDGGVDNVILMAALEHAVSRVSGIRRVSDRIVALGTGSGVPRLRTELGSRIDAEVFLLASGAWAGALPGLPRPLPVRPLCGQLVLLAGDPVRHVTYAGGGYLVPRGGSTVIGATTEETGFSCETSDAGRAQLTEIARLASPAFAAPSVEDHWAGLRPVTPDAFPIICQDPDHSGIIYACGFSRNGILLAPWAAAQLSEVFAGRAASPCLAPFHIDRFLSRG